MLQHKPSSPFYKPQLHFLRFFFVIFGWLNEILSKVSCTDIKYRNNMKNLSLEQMLLLHKRYNMQYAQYCNRHKLNWIKLGCSLISRVFTKTEKLPVLAISGFPGICSQICSNSTVKQCGHNFLCILIVLMWLSSSDDLEPPPFLSHKRSSVAGLTFKDLSFKISQL